jgi:hypothetical protein
MHYIVDFIIPSQLYMLRAMFLPIIRSTLLYYLQYQFSPKLLPAGVPNELKLNYVDCEACIHAFQST